MTWYLLGVITGIIIGVLIDRDTVYKTVQKFAKIKIKKSGDVSDVITVDSVLKQRRQLDEIGCSKKELRQRKRQIRREDRSKDVSNEQ